jgi:hypothetical protein
VTTPSYKTSAARRLAAALLGAATLAGAACSNDRFTEPNRNQPSLTGAQNDPNFVQFAASGVLAANRNQLDDYVRDVGVFGREIFNYTQTEGRNTSGFLATFSDNAGFGAGLWGLRYNNLRNIFNLNQFVEASTLFGETQKSAIRGFSATMEALELHYVIATRDTVGVPSCRSRSAPTRSTSRRSSRATRPSTTSWRASRPATRRSGRAGRRSPSRSPGASPGSTPRPPSGSSTAPSPRGCRPTAARPAAVRPATS